MDCGSCCVNSVHRSNVHYAEPRKPPAAEFKQLAPSLVAGRLAEQRAELKQALAVTDAIERRCSFRMPAVTFLCHVICCPLTGVDDGLQPVGVLRASS